MDMTSPFGLSLVLHYIVLHYIVLHYIVLHYIVLHYIVLHYIVLHYIVLHFVTLCRDSKCSCGTQQHTTSKRRAQKNSAGNRLGSVLRQEHRK